MRRHEEENKAKTVSTVRVYFMDESMPVVLEHFEAKLAGGFVIGRQGGISVAYPPHRIHHLEAISKEQEWTDAGEAAETDPYET